MSMWACLGKTEGIDIKVSILFKCLGISKLWVGANSCWHCMSCIPLMDSKLPSGDGSCLDYIYALRNFKIATRQ